MPRLTSRRHPLVARFRAAARGGAAAPLLLDGWHLLVDACAAGTALTHVAVCGDPPGLNEAAALRDVERTGTTVVEVTADVLGAMSPVRTPSGVVALAARPHVHASALWQPAPALVVVACDVQDPGNLGAIIRVAEAGGATGCIAAGESADPWHWRALRASMGSALRLPLRRMPDALTACHACRAAGLTVVALTPRHAEPPDRIALDGPVALLLGGEGPGLSDAVLHTATARLAIPMRPPVESLNVAVAAGLVVYEAARQRARTPAAHS